MRHYDSDSHSEYGDRDRSNRDFNGGLANLVASLAARRDDEYRRRADEAEKSLTVR